MSSFAAGTPQHSTLWLVVRCSRRATRQRCGHRHAGAVRRTSVSLAFCCPRTCVRGQHLIVPPTNAANAAARMQSQTRTKNSTNPSHLSSKQTPHISHSPAYKNTNPSHFPPSPTLQPHTALAAVYIYIQTPHISIRFHTPLVPRVPLSPTPGVPGRLPAPGSRLPARSHPRPRPNAARTPASTITTSPSYPAPTAYLSAHLPERARALYSQLCFSSPSASSTRQHSSSSCLRQRAARRAGPLVPNQWRLIGCGVSSMRRGDCRFCTPAFISLVRVVRRCSCCCVTLLLAADVSWCCDKHPRARSTWQSRWCGLPAMTGTLMRSVIGGTLFSPLLVLHLRTLPHPQLPLPTFSHSRSPPLQLSGRADVAIWGRVSEEARRSCSFAPSHLWGHPGVVDRLLLLSSRFQTSPPDAVLHGRLGVAIPRPLPVSLCR